MEKQKTINIPPEIVAETVVEVGNAIWQKCLEHVDWSDKLIPYPDPDSPKQHSGTYMNAIINSRPKGQHRIDMAKLIGSHVLSAIVDKWGEFIDDDNSPGFWLVLNQMDDYFEHKFSEKS